MKLLTKTKLARTLLTILVFGLPTVAPASIVELLTNGNFDAGRGVAWVEYSTSSDPVIYSNLQAPVSVHSGSYLAWFGGANNLQESLSQSFTVPNQATNLQLSGYFSGRSDEELFGSIFDTLDFRVDGNTIISFSNHNAKSASSWVRFSSDLSNVGPGEHLLTIAASNDSSAVTSFFVDTLSINATVVPLPMAIWPFITGLLGVIGIARRKKAA